MSTIQNSICSFKNFVLRLAQGPFSDSEKSYTRRTPYPILAGPLPLHHRNRRSTKVPVPRTRLISMVLIMVCPPPAPMGCPASRTLNPAGPPFQAAPFCPPVRGCTRQEILEDWQNAGGRHRRPYRLTSTSSTPSPRLRPNHRYNLRPKPRRTRNTLRLPRSPR